jgi:hypothetical protein
MASWFWELFTIRFIYAGGTSQLRVGWFWIGLFIWWLTR